MPLLLLLQDVAAKGAGTAKPVVVFVSHFFYDPSESYQISWASYKVQLATDAGAQVLSFDEVKAIKGACAGEAWE